MTNSSPPKVNPLSTAAAGRSESPDVPVNAAQQEADATEISMVIESLKLQADADRREYVMKRMEENRIKVAEITRNRHQLSIERTNQMNMNGNKFDNLLSRRQQEAIDMQKRGEIRFGGSSSSQEDDPVIPLGPGIVLNSSVRPIILPKVEKLPRHVTSVFIDRNQRRIYDDHNGFSDEEEEEREFAGPEDNIIRMTVEEVGASDTVFDLLAKRLSREPCEVKARYEALVSRKNATESSKPGETDSAMNALLDKRLEEAQAPFDYLFCRQCLIFDCKFHGHGQELVYPVTSPSPSSPAAFPTYFPLLLSIFLISFPMSVPEAKAVAKKKM
ncbi:hypothetical protein Ccrd_012624 [Cynara cardunculus var. scolymus]|uniref:Histone-lysine N-methyltransferase CLF-like HTH domain-containing protein n=1 Tax=Cynara cardunculus var. scolymus TaxID=59895 RepID=A0A103YH62_CYNCS|nr:hypothetical protein Ccrd_012624 [Cynara cardunculus var. scolymus]